MCLHKTRNVCTPPFLHSFDRPLCVDNIQPKQYTRVIDLTEFCNTNEWCMLVTSSALVIEFKENASLFISSENKCHFEISSSAYMELWTRDQKNLFPVRYEYVPELGARSADYFQRLHDRYHYLMQDPALNANFDIILPSFGYDPITLGWNPRFLTLNGKERQAEIEREQEYYEIARSFSLNQYGSNFDPEEKQEEQMNVELDLLTRIIGAKNSLQSSTHLLSHKQLSHIKVYFKKPDSILPRFTLKDDRNKKRLYLTVVEDNYKYSGESHMIYGLCIVPGGPLICHFMISSNRKFMLFLPQTQ